MKNKLRNCGFLLLLLIPLLAFDVGYFYFLQEIYYSWQQQEQKHQANQKLGEIAAVTKLNYHMSSASQELNEKLKDALLELNEDKFKNLPWEKVVKNIFAPPFPKYELFMFYRENSHDTGKIFYSGSDKVLSRRSLEISFSCLLDIHYKNNIKESEKSRNEKILKKIFGSGTEPYLMAEKHKAVVTPVIYDKIPSFLIWDSVQERDGRCAGYFLIVKRNQNLEGPSLKLAARSSGLGKEVAGGFIKLFESANSDYFFPGSIAAYDSFAKWRNSIGLGSEETLNDWQLKGFPWQRNLGAYSLFTRILPEEKHLLFILLPTVPKFYFKKGMFILHLFFFALFILALFRGLILDQWPGQSIRTRFAMVFLLGATLPMILFFVSSSAYVFDRMKADEKRLEEMLATSLLDFDAGKEQMETDYRDSFRRSVQDEEVLKILTQHKFSRKEVLMKAVKKNFVSSAEELPLAGISFIDLNGNLLIEDSREIPMQDLEPMMSFYGHNMALNLRKHFSYSNPEHEFAPLIVDEKILAAHQAYGKEGNSMEIELERFRGRIFRTKFGRGKIVTVHDFIYIDGQPRFAIFVCWLDNSVNDRILSRSANMLALKNPKIKVLAFKNSAEGLKLVFRPDRSFNQELISLYKRVANASLVSKTELNKSVEKNMSLVGYSSPHFFNIVLVAGMEHHEKNHNHFIRLIIFSLTAVAGIVLIIFSGLATYVRIARPLEKIKNTLDQVSQGNFTFQSDEQRNDEIGILNSEFKTMISGLQQRERLASILSDHAVAAISTEESSLKGQEAEGVVLISDIRNFTVMGETHSPAVLTEMLNRHFAEMATIIVDNGGRIYKFIGDAIEAVFFDEQEQSSSAKIRALKAAILMLKRLETINQSRIREGSFAYKIGIGLACGDIISGETGSIETRLEFAMLGKPFKKAEALEGLSKISRDLPLIMDDKIAESARNIGFMLSELPFENEKVYSAAISSLDKIVSETQISQPSQTVAKNVPQTQAQAIFKTPIERMANFRNRKVLVFLAGVFCLAFAFFTFIGVDSLHFAKLQKQSLQEPEELLNLGAIKGQYGGPRSLLEDLLQFESDQVAARLPWQEGKDDISAFESSVEQMLQNLSDSGINPSQFVVLHCSQASGAIRLTDSARLSGCQLTHFKGSANLRDDCKKLLERLLMRIMISRYPRVNEMQDIDPKLPEILGFRHRIEVLYNDFHARAFEVSRRGKTEYFYWQPILQRNPDFRVDLADENVAQYLRQKPDPNSLKCVGALLIHIPTEVVENKLFKILERTFKNDGLEYAIVFANGRKILSTNFPLEQDSVSFNSNLPKKSENWLFKTTHGQREDLVYRIILAKKLVKEPDTGRAFPVIASISLAFLLFIWYRTVFLQQALAVSLAKQLWTGLLIASIVPVAAVYLVNELNAVDREKISIDQERAKLINLFEKLERRQLLQETLSWEKIDAVCSDSELAQLINICDKNPTKDNLQQVEDKIFSLVKQKVRFSEAIVYSNRGWQRSIYPEKQKRETADFKRFVQVFVREYFIDLGSDEFPRQNTPLGNAVKEEMTKDGGLEVFRNLFGSDAYFALVHGLDIPIRIFANTGLACMKMLPEPQITRPKRIFFWLFLDNMNNTLRKIFRGAEVEFAIFTDSKVMYGSQKQPHEAGNIANVVNACRWANATKAPLSISTKIAGSKFRIEARNGRHNEVMLLVGLIPEELILDKVDQNRRNLLFWLICTVAAIIFLSLRLSSDFIRPITALTKGAISVSRQDYGVRLETERNDELGQLLQTFNGMVKGLQEKELMGKMVSKAAQVIASDENRLKEAEKGMKLDIAILYVAVPGFSTFIDTMAPKQLIEELKIHIATLCSTIIANGGDIDKLMGEKILAIFYSDKGSEETMKRLLKTLEDIRNLERMGHLPFPVTTGAHSGEVLAGLLGVGSQRDFTVIGDPVNTAARICSKASELPRDRFLVSDLVASLGKNQAIEFRNFAEVELKGKAETIKLFQLFFKR